MVKVVKIAPKSTREKGVFYCVISPGAHMKLSNRKFTIIKFSKTQ